MLTAGNSVILSMVTLGIFVGPHEQDPARRTEEGTITSVYTGLTTRECKTVRIDKESGSSSQRCEGVAGYKLLVEDSDNRMSVTVVDPGGQRHPLDFWSVITPNFSTLGTKAEWRIARKMGRAVPVALIVRVDAIESPETSKVTSYLAVAKITEQSVCVIDKIGPIQNANQKAREVADLYATKTCLAR